MAGFKDLGIVVIGRNEGQRLVNCLESLQQYRIPIVYVDSGSTDGSIDTATKFGVSVVKLDRHSEFTAARARNEGLATLLELMPNTKFVQFIDGDCELVSTWLAAAYEFITDHKDAASICGRRRERFPERSIYNRLCDIEWNTSVGEATACGGDSLVRVEAFTQAGGFNPSLMSGEEPELCIRIRERGWKIWRLDAEMTRHDASMTKFRQWWQRAVRSGYGEAEVTHLYGASRLVRRERREVARAVFWGGLAPLWIISISYFHPSALLGLVVYPLQIGRIAFRRGSSQVVYWVFGAFMLIAKFAQLQGNLMYCFKCLRRRPMRSIEYK